mmetsp:Transcript_49904/g.165237  ORF Transcript_49904/g.165237 Transcript_49904/m.165237 type:complete len:519 (+) Transcript_49904:22-1578(+)
MSIEVEASDVVRVVLQFLSENKLNASLAALQKESGISLNATDSVDRLTADVLAGRWDAVLTAVAPMSLPRGLLSELYEQVVVELLELREPDTARQMLRGAAPLLAMKAHEPKRHARLEALAARPYFEARDAYDGGVTRESRRSSIAEGLRAEVAAVPPARLLTLLGHALKWQRQQGMLPPEGTKFDVLAGGAARRLVEREAYVSVAGPVIKFGKKSHAECAAFSPDGAFLVSGSIDGFLEVWDFERGKLRLDLPYQESDQLMMHDAAVLSLGFSRDSELLASGSQDGVLKVWRPRTGQCVRRFPKAHAGGVTCVAFARDGLSVATGSFDALVRVHGLKSGKSLKEMRGHTSYVNGVDWSADGSRLASASSDGSVRVWDAKSCDCLHSFRPPAPTGAELAVNSATFLPNSSDALLVCNRSAEAFVTSLSGDITTRLASGKREGGDFIASMVTAQGGWVHAVAEDGFLYSFDLGKGELGHLLKAHEKDVIGVVSHPHRNLVATWSDDGTLRLWRASAHGD